MTWSVVGDIHGRLGYGFDPEDQNKPKKRCGHQLTVDVSLHGVSLGKFLENLGALLGLPSIYLKLVNSQN